MTILVSATKIPHALWEAFLLIIVKFSIQTESDVTEMVELINFGLGPVNLTLLETQICLLLNVPVKFNISPSWITSLSKFPSSSM